MPTFQAFFGFVKVCLSSANKFRSYSEYQASGVNPPSQLSVLGTQYFIFCYEKVYFKMKISTATNGWAAVLETELPLNCYFMCIRAQK